MTTRFFTLLGLVIALTGLANAQEATTKPTWAYAHDLRVRKGGTTDFDKDTPKIGVEFFKDDATGAVVVITQAGFLTVAPMPAIGTDKKAGWLFAHDLRARKGDEDKFTATTAKFGVEAFKDAASGKLLYVSEKATLALADPPSSVLTDKEPVWHHALIVKVRGANEKAFGKDTAKFGIEVFKDGNTGGLIYISDTASIATAPAPSTAPAPDKVKAPKALYGLTLRTRKADEADFGKDTKSYGIEVFRDENTGGLIYVSETGAIATAPPAETKTGQGVTWKHAMTLKARAGGVTEFAKATAFGIEVFQDNNTGNLVYISDIGAIGVLPKK